MHMTDKSNRRSVLKGLAAISGSAVISPAVVSADSNGRITMRTAETIAERKVEQLAAKPEFDDWDIDGISAPVLFFAPVERPVRGIIGEYFDMTETSYEPSAYVFPIRQGGHDVGFITISAQKTLQPVLGYSRDTPPQRNLQTAREIAREHGLEVNDRLLYKGGVSYGVETVGGQVIDLRTDLTGGLKTLPGFSSLELGGENAHHWRKHDQRASPLTTLDTGRADDDIEGVPDWVEEDDGGAEDRSYPETIGSDPDPWADWDGCSPVSSSLIVGYHEEIDPEDQDAIDGLIDVLHRKMNTDDESGGTSLRDIPRGISAYDRGEYTYQAQNYSWNRKQQVRRQIAADQPPALSMIDGGKETDGRYGNHTVAIVGYSEEGEKDEQFFYKLHTGWGGFGAEWIAHGNWEHGVLTAVNASKKSDSGTDDSGSEGGTT
jgi:hypothetical protein